MANEDLSFRKAQLSAAKQELVEKRLKRAGRTSASSCGIPRRPQAAPSSLSFAQQALWFLDQMAPESPAYINSRFYRMCGTLDREALEASLTEILRRHESLRTHFETLQGQPIPVIDPPQPVSLEAVDLRNVSAVQRETEIQRLALEVTRRPFDLTRSPLVRFDLFRLTEVDHLLLVTIHHIVSDEWSFEIFAKELGSLYESFCCDKGPLLGELPIQFGDFAVWQRQFLVGNELDKRIGYWRQRLNGAPSILQLPLDRPRPALQSYRGEVKKFIVCPELKQKLKELSRRENATLFMTLLAAFTVVLKRYTGQEDILLGSPIAGRNRTEVEGLIGFFVNTLVLRIDCSGDPTFHEVLRRTRQVALDAYAHQDLPFEKLVEALQPHRDSSYSPLFQVMFVFQNAPLIPPKMPDLNLSVAEIHNRTAKFDLTLIMREDGSSLVGEFEYNTDLFEGNRISRMVGHFQNLLEGIVANPGMPIGDLPLLTAVERQQILVNWNDTRVDYPKDVLLHHLFEAQVERTPDAIAVECGGLRLSYRELNCQANRLARHLGKLGVVADTLVGVCMERCLDLVVALYGVVKAGGAYVPIDPEYPQERVEFMLQDAGVPVLLTQSRLAQSLGAHRTRVVCLDKDRDLIAKEESGNAAIQMRSDNLAYMIYTSGSTGKPKGAMNTHRGICNRLLWMQDRYGLTKMDKVLQKTPFSFDVSVWEFFWPLQTGARLVLAEPGGHRDSAYLVKLITEKQITVIHFVPSMLLIFLEDPGVQSCRSLRHVICSGEALPFDLQERFFELLPAELHNLYGPTEAAVDVTAWTCQRRSERKIVPIGRPIANTQVYVLDRRMQPAPVGVPGELYIGGVQVGRGYHNRSNLTSERFIPDPYGGSSDARLYKTGDLCRWLEDGSVEYLGRMDFQVKIRGFRVELGEIEAVLQQSPGVDQAVAIVRDYASGDQRLVAYVVPKSGDSPTEQKLRAYLETKLPYYMVPSRLLVLEALPLTPNGKIDRGALPEPGNIHEVNYVEPCDELEIRLADIWQRVLRTRRVGVTDNFFELGGHSLLAAQLFAKIETVLGRRLPLATIFRAPTVKQLASTLRQQEWKPNWSSLVAVQPAGSKPPLFLCHGAEGNVLLYRDLAICLGPDQPVYGLQSQGLDGSKNFPKCLEQMASHYVAEVRSLQPEGPYYLGGYCMGGGVSLEMAQQLHAQGQKVALVALLETYNICQNPKAPSLLLRCYYFAQTLKFHFENFTMLGRDDAFAFFRRKAKIQRSRIKAALHIWLSTRLPRLRRSERSPYPHVSLARYNDRAFAQYRPQPFAGRLVLFRPKKYYARLDDPEFGWRGIARDGVDVRHLPVSPRGMLVQPFVRLLAEKLKVYLEKTT